MHQDSRIVNTSKCLAVLVTASIAGLLGACSKDPGVCAIVRLPAGVAPDQASFRFVNDEGKLWPEAGPQLIHASAGQPIENGSSFCLYVDSSRAGKEVSCRVQVLSAGEVIAEGGATVVLQSDKAVDCTPVLSLRPSTGAPPPHASGCADETREAFLDAAAFPNVAACGGDANAQVVYQTAYPRAEELCQAGWHWCRPVEISMLPDVPLPTANAAIDRCAWLDFQTASCDAPVVFSIANSTCGGLQLARSPISPTADGPCNWPSGDAQADCSLSWKLAVTLEPDRWASVSYFDKPTCYSHAIPACGAPPSAPAGMTATQSCWVACCKD